jgi:cation:H+ antiporter
MPVVTVGLFVLGLVLLIGGSEMLVRGASRLATAVGVSPLVVGLTVVAFGTSAPELAVSVQSALAGQSGLAVGNVVGSNILNVLLILGLSAVILPLTVAQQLIRLDVPLMIAASLLFFVFALDGVLGRGESGLLFAGAAAYTVFCIRQSRKESARVQQEYAEEFADPAPGKHGRGYVVGQFALIAGGLLLLLLGARWLVDGAVTFARQLGVSELIIGLTIIAIGTSLPEIATTVMASLRGERDIAVGNVIGSNLFNLLVVIGVTGIVAPAGVTVPAAALRFDIPVMIAVAVACLPVFFSGGRIARWEGGLFLATTSPTPPT